MCELNFPFFFRPESGNAVVADKKANPIIPSLRSLKADLDVRNSHIIPVIRKRRLARVESAQVESDWNLTRPSKLFNQLGKFNPDNYTLKRSVHRENVPGGDSPHPPSTQRKLPEVPRSFCLEEPLLLR